MSFDRVSLPLEGVPAREGGEFAERLGEGSGGGSACAFTSNASVRTPILDRFPQGAEGSFARDAAPEVILRSVLKTHRGRIALVSSFGAESAALLHMVAAIDPATPVIFLDTGKLFQQTLDYRLELAERLGLTDVRDRRPAFADLAINDPGANLWKSDPDACCAIRKVAPLDKALEGFDAWITGRKRFHGAGRARLPMIEHEAGKVKINPLANIAKAELDAYVTRHALPSHPLVSGGYASVGCWPCTKPSEDLRAGRWAGSEKTECGIHRPAKAAADLGGGV